MGCSLESAVAEEERRGPVANGEALRASALHDAPAEIDDGDVFPIEQTLDLQSGSLEDMYEMETTTPPQRMLCLKSDTRGVS